MAKAISHTLMRNRSLEHLDISQNPFARDGEIGRILGEALSRNQSLRSLRITLNDPKRIKFASSSNIVKFFGQPTSVTNNRILGLIGAKLSSVSVNALAKCIASGWLVNLDLSFGFMGEKAAKILANAISGKVKGNPSRVGSSRYTSSKMRLEKLNISHNAVGQIGCAALHGCTCKESYASRI